MCLPARRSPPRRDAPGHDVMLSSIAERAPPARSNVAISLASASFSVAPSATRAARVATRLSASRCLVAALCSTSCPSPSAKTSPCSYTSVAAAVAATMLRLYDCGTRSTSRSSISGVASTAGRWRSADSRTSASSASAESPFSASSASSVASCTAVMAELMRSDTFGSGTLGSRARSRKSSPASASALSRSRSSTSSTSSCLHSKNSPSLSIIDAMIS
mmetsp:Transcript_15694/g.48793  ORF Transcript_15694/g.48793 Transcript_15694/m.48793 type:complete len:219 (+) Transcript_15694:118-774(+)